MTHHFYEEIEALLDTPCVFEDVVTPWDSLNERSTPGQLKSFSAKYAVIPKKANLKTLEVTQRKLAMAMVKQIQKGSPKATAWVRDPFGVLGRETLSPKRLALFVKRMMSFSQRGDGGDPGLFKKIDAGKLGITQVDGGYKLAMSVGG